MKRLLAFIFTYAAVTLQSLSLAQSPSPSAMPGQASAVPAPLVSASPPAVNKKTPVKAPSSVAARATCVSDFANPPVGNLQFTSDGSEAYALLNVKVETSSSTTSPKGSTALYHINFPSRTAEPMLTLSVPQPAWLLLWGDPLEAVTVGNFSQAALGCPLGHADLVNVLVERHVEPGPQFSDTPKTAAEKQQQALWKRSLAISGASKKGRPSPRAVIVSGAFTFVRTPGAKTLADVDRRAILEFDGPTLQTRVATEYAENEWPLYYDRSDRMLITWNESPRGILLYRGSKAKPVERLAIKPGDRLLQDGTHWLTIGRDLASKKDTQVAIRSIAKWSDVAEERAFTLDLPRRFPLSQTHVTVRLEKRIALFQGATDRDRRNLHQALLFDLTTGKVTAEIEAPAGQYIEWAEVSPRADYALLEMRSLTTGLTEKIQLLDLGDQKLIDLKIASASSAVAVTPDKKPKIKPPKKTAPATSTERAKRPKP